MKHPFSRFFGLGEKEQGNQIVVEEVEEVEQEDTAEEIREEVKKIPIKDITPNRFQPRTVFSNEKIEELALTIRTHGII